MRTLPLIGVLALFGMTMQPATAQMCAPGQQAQAATPAQAGMCARAQDDPMADKPAEKPKMSGMCPCCSGMAMMRGGGMQHEKPMENPKP